MTEYLMKKYALSRQGAKDLIKGTLACALSNLVLMLPAGLLYLLVQDLSGGRYGGALSFLYRRRHRRARPDFRHVGNTVPRDLFCDV